MIAWIRRYRSWERTLQARLWDWGYRLVQPDTAQARLDALNPYRR